MRFIDEYRDAQRVGPYVEAIRRVVSRPWSIMEVCGGQTHAIVRFGLDELLPPEISLLHGPGCPVCVTPIELIDRALEIASRREVTFCSFGDMLRVPGSSDDLFAVKSRGGDVRVVYSPLDALALAERLPDREVVFFAVGFETTAPANAMAVFEARRRGIRNFSLLVSHVLVPPAMEVILRAPDRRVDGFLAAGHVCTVMGIDAYRPLAAEHRVPIVVTGFEPMDILQGIFMCVRQLEEGRAEVENQYARSVREAGNEAAQRMIREVFEVVPRTWRGIGPIARSGLGLRAPYADHDAERRWAPSGDPEPRASDQGSGRRAPSGDPEPRMLNTCRSGLVLQGIIKPPDCPAFGVRCTPETPLGATMVSAEGACAAYYRYRRADPPCDPR
ncbi:hydrogenase formation protein HupD [Sorangium cellulosum]|uniref:Hydrogenase formation protein HupD n=1 Tax=Sorangium cellulosum TaxID=56 RepID=A0A150TAL4_SORCE|nr:hydrogenase formation protein HupD [Sorangium cellulosum]KYG01734.1 hydrogenase formation protein HupD [Sorangium cellulosum]